MPLRLSGFLGESASSSALGTVPHLPAAPPTEETRR
jgi:hypothetical protein